MSATVETKNAGAPNVLSAMRPSRNQAILLSVFILGLSIRFVIVFNRIGTLYIDELFQYLEQGHRLAFGSGVVPWEYDYGIRSWLLPSSIAGVMKVSSWVSSSPLTYIYVLRSIAAFLSLVVIYVGFQLVLPRAGLIWATITSLFCAIWFQAVLVSPSLLTEVLAAYLMLSAILLADNQAQDGSRRSAVLGVLLGLALCLRFQMVPALVVIACWHCRIDWRRKWLPTILAGGAVVCVLGGLFDWVTLGSPFQSIWLNFDLNAIKGVSASFGRAPWYDYLTDIAPSGALLFLMWVAIIGGYRAPLLALTSLTVLISHSLLAHKEPRFIVFALLSLPILIGLGTATIAERLSARLGQAATPAVIYLAVLSIFAISYFEWQRIPRDNYPPDSAVLHAFLAAHDQPTLCGLGVADYLWTVTGGYTYFHRDVPLYYSSYLTPAQQSRFYDVQRPSLGKSKAGIALRMHVILKGQPILQFPGDELSKNSRSFNYLIAADGRSIAGYSTIRCFANEADPRLPAACLLRRAGGCTEP